MLVFGCSMLMLDNQPIYLINLATFCFDVNLIQSCLISCDLYIYNLIRSSLTADNLVLSSYVSIFHLLNLSIRTIESIRVYQSKGCNPVVSTYAIYLFLKFAKSCHLGRRCQIKCRNIGQTEWKKSMSDRWYCGS
jgi:hypothetical protein